MTQTPVVFFGTGPVAAKSLELLAEDFLIEAVITKGHDGQPDEDSPVLQIAKQIKTKILYVNNQKEVDEVCSTSIFNSQMGVLIDFGIIVSENTINSFQKGIINSHFSLLPEWRGADPITFSLLSGQKHTGVSLMMLTKGMDEGPILAQQALPIDANDTGITLTDKLINLSHKMLVEFVPKYLTGLISPIDQIEYSEQHNLAGEPSYSTKITKKHGQIDWNKPAEIIEREIRAFQPWPRSFTKIGKELIISIFEARINNSLKLYPGEVHVVKDSLFVGTKTDALELLQVQPAGKKKMPTKDFLRGNLNKLFVQVS